MQRSNSFAKDNFLSTLAFYSGKCQLLVQACVFGNTRQKTEKIEQSLAAPKWAEGVKNLQV